KDRSSRAARVDSRVAHIFWRSRMTDIGIRETILELFRQREAMKELSEDDDFFDMGASSLTIVSLQISVEAAIHRTLPTSDLMRMSTMREWIEAYTSRASEQEKSSV